MEHKDFVTGRHSGQRFIIGGTSPNLKKLDPGFLESGKVIAVNRFPHFRDKFDYWLTCDPQHIVDRMEGVENKIKHVQTFVHTHPKVMHEWATYRFQRPKETILGESNQPNGYYATPTHWCGELQHIWTSATAAANLAAIMGASEIILYGVDIKGITIRGKGAIEWGELAPDISSFLNRLPCPVYKTKRSSPLDLPYFDTVENRVMEA